MLHTLSVAGNSIRRLSGLDGLVGLKVLNIEGNRIK
jgi:Leucine-rich repeat (LRR) protein